MNQRIKDYILDVKKYNHSVSSIVRMIKTVFSVKITKEQVQELLKEGETDGNRN